MTSPDPKWTTQQKAAITQTGREVLVTASAGTGKTAVLSARCAQLLADPDNTRASQMLVLTFTEAAAAEMRYRIHKAIKEIYSQHPEPRLRSQLLMLDGADISTIDSFCKKLVTENFYHLGIDPTFRILDPDEQQLIKSELLNELLIESYADPVLSQSLSELFYRRKVDGQNNLSRSIVAIHDYLEGVCFRDEWFAKSRSMLNSDLREGPLGAVQKELIISKLIRIAEQLSHTAMLDQKLHASQAWSAQIANEYMPVVEKCLAAAKKNDMVKCADIINEFEKSKWKNKDKSLDKDMADLIKAAGAKALAEFKNLSQLAVLNSRYVELVGSTETHHGKILLELVQRFACKYTDRKKQLNCLDFADLEHNALSLLSVRQNDSLDLSPLAIKLREHYKYVLIDEFQDISAVQEAIIASVSRQDNLFIVGDVKQSIYAWRQAQPEIFINRLKKASLFTAPMATKAVAIPLTSNFRSRPEVLGFVNLIFERIMTQSFAGINYDSTARLEAGTDHKPLKDHSLDGKNDPAVQLHFLIDDNADEDDNDENNDGDGNNASDADLEKTTGRTRQAALVARLIKDMVTGYSDSARFEVVDRESKIVRPIEYRDIVILMRGLSKTANEYAQTLRLHGVPVSSQNAVGYFETTEITDCVTLLSVLDNPQKDIELAALLRSPFFRLSDSDLANIRIFSPDTDFYHAFTNYAAAGQDAMLRGRVIEIAAQIDSWRSAARQGSISDLLWNIFATTNFLAFVCALPNGSQRRANVLKFHQRAIEFENFVSSAKGVSLARFIDFLQKLLEQGQDWSAASPENCAENAVQIMSVHKSKGLEFPVVILAGLDTKFNTSDLAQTYLVDPDHGVGLRVIAPGAKNSVSGLTHQVISEKKKAQGLAEEMRVLYVAMTRARERLILTASATTSEITNTLYNAAAAQSPLPDWMLAESTKPLKWLLLALARQKNMLDTFNINLDISCESSDLFSVTVHGHDELIEISKSLENLRKNSAQNKTVEPTADKEAVKKMFERFRSSIQWQYPFDHACRIQAKTSVSDFLNHRRAIPLSQYQQVLADWPHIDADFTSPAEKAMLIGTATHLLMQRITLEALPDRESIALKIRELVDASAISESIAEAINIAGIVSFFENSLGKMLFDPQNTIYRELPFTAGIDASCFVYDGAELTGEKVVVQGIIDLLIQTPKGLIIVDFKTDHITAAQAPLHAQNYCEQLRLYAQAASDAFNQPVIAKYLYFLSPAVAAEVN